MEEIDNYDFMSDELSYQRVSEDVHKKVYQSWTRLRKDLENSTLSEEVQKKVKDFNDLMNYFFV